MVGMKTRPARAVARRLRSRTLVCTFHLPLSVLLAEVVPLVVKLLPTHEREGDLGDAVPEVDVQWHERESLLFDLPEQLAQLAPLHQELARTERVVVEAISLLVRRDVQVMQPE